MALAPFKPKDGLHLREVGNGGFVVEGAASERGMMPNTIGAYTDAKDMVRDLAAALGVDVDVFVTPRADEAHRP